MIRPCWLDERVRSPERAIIRLLGFESQAQQLLKIGFRVRDIDGEPECVEERCHSTF